MFGQDLRFRSPDNVIEEIRLLKDQYGIDSIFFHDDTFTINHAWVKEFCSQLDKSRLNILWGCNSRIDTVNEEILKIMYETGLRNIHFGIESASQRILDSIYNKQIKLEKITDVISLTNTIGISAMGFFMLGAPSETTQEINSTIAFARSLKLREASFSLTTPLAGTYLFQSLLKGGMFTMDKHYDNFNYYSKYTIKGGISCRQIKFLQLKAFLLFYLHPFRLKYIARHLLNPRGIRKLLNKVRRSL